MALNQNVEPGFLRSEDGVESADVVEDGAHLVVDVGVVADDSQVDVVPGKVKVAVADLEQCDIFTSSFRDHS